MNLLLLCDEYPPGRHGGIGTSVQLLARALVKQGHQVVVSGFCDWGYGGEDFEKDEGVLVYRFRRGLDRNFFQQRDTFIVRAAYRIFTITGIFERDIRKSLTRYRRFLEELITRHQVELVEMPDYNEYINYIRHAVPFPRLPVPVVVKLHGSITYFKEEGGQTAPGYIKETEHKILTNADAVTSVSQYTATKTAGYFQYQLPITVLYNGIELPEIKKTAENKQVVVFSGSLLAKKGIYQLAKAWNIVHKNASGAQLLVYGKGPAAKVEQLLTPGARKSVHFMGHVNRTALLSQLANARLAVFPSQAECFSMAPMEAMAAGTATIYTKKTSGPELITDGVNGILVKPDDIHTLADAILELLENAPFREKLAAAGYKRVCEDFDINVIALNHVRFYQSIVAKTVKQPHSYE